MAAYAPTTHLEATLGAGVEDVVTFAKAFDEVEVENRHATATLSFTVGESHVAAVSGADGTLDVSPGKSRVVPTNSDRGFVVGIISASAVPYAVSGLTSVAEADRT